MSLGGVPEAIFDNTPYLRRQFSPDGTRMVVSVEGQLVVIDLVAGRTRSLGVSGYMPSWSKDGSRIAFVFQTPVGAVVPPAEVIGVVPSGGGLVQQMALVGYARQSAEWSPDGSMLILPQPDDIVIVEVASGRVIRRIAETSEAGSSFAHWRVGAPAIAIGVTGCERAMTRILGLDSVIATDRTLAAADGCQGLNLRDPRWSPVRDELLYVAARAAPGLEPSEYRTHLLDARSGKDTILPVLAWEATWSWDGTEIAYIARGTAWSHGNAVRLWPRDGGGEQELLRATGDDFFFSIASLSY